MLNYLLYSSLINVPLATSGTTISTALYSTKQWIKCKRSSWLLSWGS